MNIHSLLGMAIPRDDKKRVAILSAGLKLFSTKGYYGTAVPLVAQEAGVAAGTIYRYFKDKPQLVNTIFREQKERILNFVMASYVPSASWEERFQGIFKAIVNFGFEYPHAFNFLEFHHHQSYLDQESLDLEAMVISQIRMIFEMAQSEGAVRAADPSVLMHLVWGAVVGLLKAHRQEYLNLNARAVNLAAEICWQGIAA